MTPDDHDQQRRRQAADPMAPPAALLGLASVYPAEVLANVAVGLLAFEDQPRWQAITSRARIELAERALRTLGVDGDRWRDLAMAAAGFADQARAPARGDLTRAYGTGYANLSDPTWLLAFAEVREEQVAYLEAHSTPHRLLGLTAPSHPGPPQVGRAPPRARPSLPPGPRAPW